ncbi:hypothetical protein U1Q18_041337 [Sarracenia purpurea var. burkii]
MRKRHNFLDLKVASGKGLYEEIGREEDLFIEDPTNAHTAYEREVPPSLKGGTKKKKKTLVELDLLNLENCERKGNQKSHKKGQKEIKSQPH